MAQYVWYTLDPADARRPRPVLDAGLLVRRGMLEDLALIGQLPRDPSVETMHDRLVRRRLAQGGEVWLVLDGDRTVFGCWMFRGRGPMHGGRRGGIDLPPGVVYLEDILVAPAYRGRGIAAAACATMADACAASDRRLMMKVDVLNTACHRAVAKAGFRDGAHMRIEWHNWRTRISVMLGDEHELAWLEGLARG